MEGIKCITNNQDMSNIEYSKYIQSILLSHRSELKLTHQQLNQAIISLVSKPNKTNEDLRALKKIISSLSAFSEKEEEELDRVLDKITSNVSIASLQKGEQLQACGEATDAYYTLLEGNCYLLLQQKQKELSNPKENSIKSNEVSVSLKDNTLVENFIKLSETQPEISYSECGLKLNETFPDMAVFKRLDIGFSFGDIHLLTGKRMMCTIICGSDSKFLKISKNEFNIMVDDFDRRQASERIQFLSQFSFFQNIPNFKIALLLQDSNIIHSRLEQSLYIEGDPCEKIFFIQKGTVQLSKKISVTQKNETPQSKNNLEGFNINEERKQIKEEIETTPMVILGEGQYFGQEEILRNENKRNSKAEVISREASIIALRADFLFEVIREYGGLKELFGECNIRSKFQTNRESFLENGMRKQLILKRRHKSQLDLLTFHQATQRNQSNQLLSQVSDGNNQIKPQSRQSNQSSSSHKKKSIILHSPLKLKTSPILGLDELLSSPRKLQNCNNKNDNSPKKQITLIPADSPKKEPEPGSPTKRIQNTQLILINQEAEKGLDDFKKEIIKVKRLTKALSIIDLQAVKTRKSNNHQPIMETVSGITSNHIPNIIYYNDPRQVSQPCLVRKEESCDSVKDKYQKLSTLQKIKAETDRNGIRRKQMHQILREKSLSSHRSFENVLLQQQSSKNFFGSSQLSISTKDQTNQKIILNLQQQAPTTDEKTNNITSTQDILTSNLFLQNRDSQPLNASIYKFDSIQTDSMKKQISLRILKFESNLSNNNQVEELNTTFMVKKKSVSTHQYPSSQVMMETTKNNNKNTINNTQGSTSLEKIIFPQMQDLQKYLKSKKRTKKPQQLDLLNCLYQKDEETQRLLKCKLHYASQDRSARKNQNVDTFRSTLCSLISNVTEEEASPISSEFQCSQNTFPLEISPKIINPTTPRLLDKWNLDFYKKKTQETTSMNFQQEKNTQDRKYSTHQYLLSSPKIKSENTIQKTDQASITDKIPSRIQAATTNYDFQLSKEKSSKLRSSKLLNTWEPQKLGWRNSSKDGYRKDQKNINIHTMNLTQHIEQQKQYIRMKKFSLQQPSQDT